MDSEERCCTFLYFTVKSFAGSLTRLENKLYTFNPHIRTGSAARDRGTSCRDGGVAAYDVRCLVQDSVWLGFISKMRLNLPVLVGIMGLRWASGILGAR
jgi:hypothetical protein